jgi:deoxyadenosine/deoxycytidine kinase
VKNYIEKHKKMAKMQSDLRKWRNILRMFYQDHEKYSKLQIKFSLKERMLLKSQPEMLCQNFIVISKRSVVSLMKSFQGMDWQLRNSLLMQWKILDNTVNIRRRTS